MSVTWISSCGKESHIHSCLALALQFQSACSDSMVLALFKLLSTLTSVNEHTASWNQRCRFTCYWLWFHHIFLSITNWYYYILLFKNTLIWSDHSDSWGKAFRIIFTKEITLIENAILYFLEELISKGTVLGTLRHEQTDHKFPIP